MDNDLEQLVQNAPNTNSTEQHLNNPKKLKECGP